MNTIPDWNKQTHHIPVEGGMLAGFLHIPQDPRGVVLFVHGSGSSRYSSRNQFVARTCSTAGLATLLIDLLTAQEEDDDRFTEHLRFNIDLLSERVLQTTHWLAHYPATAALKLGYFGASTGAAAACVAASRSPQSVQAIVSRGGRPDLALPYLDRVQTPTLLIVGEYDTQVLALNRSASTVLSGTKQLEIVPGATHLFEEPGTLEHVAQLARRWFLHYLAFS